MLKRPPIVVNYHLPDTYEAYVHRSGRTARAGAEGLSISIIQQEEVQNIPEFEKELGLVFSEYKKQNPENREETNLVLWAKKIFKTKPNRSISDETKEKIKTLFHHLTKEELIEKVLADTISQKSAAHSQTPTSQKK